MIPKAEAAAKRSRWMNLYDKWHDRATAQAREIWDGELYVNEDGSVFLGNMMFSEAGAVEQWIGSPEERELYPEKYDEEREED